MFIRHLESEDAIDFIFNKFYLLLLFSCSVVSDSATPWTGAHRLPCLSLSPRACSKSCPLSLWCHPTILSSVVPFSSHVQSFPASGSFSMSQFFASGGQLQHQSLNEHSELISFKIDWLDLLAVQGTVKNLFQHHSWKASVLQHSAFSMVQLSHPYMTTGRIIAWTLWNLLVK